MQLNSIEGIKTAVSLGVGAAFVSSSAIEKEIELKTIEILKIDNIRIRTLSIISNPNATNRKLLNFFYKELIKLKII
jgi:DNA-binding transcriptional LysR family regulator